MINKEEIERIQKEEIEAYKKFKNQKCTMTLFEEFFDDIENLLNEYLKLKEIDQEHQKLNGELQQKLTKLENHYNCRLVDIDMYKKRVAELEEIINGKAIQELGTSKFYLDEEDKR